MEEFEAQETNDSKDIIGGARVVRATDPDTYSDPDSARVRARQLGCIGIRRYMNRNGGQSWMPCTNESDYRKYSGQGYSGRKYRRQQFDRDVRESIGRNYGRAFREKSANYTKPELRERIKNRILNGSKGGRPGQWSARKAQLLAIAYRKAGGGYKGGKSKKQRSLVRWGKEKWRTSDGKPAIRGSVTRRYLPAKAWSKLTPAQRAATNRKKIAGSKRGRQFVANTEAAASARKRVSRGMKHIEFYEELESKAIGRRLGGSVGRAIKPGGDGGRGPRSGRAARRAIGGRMRVVPFDPNPIDADADLSVQEGTIHERLITPEQSLASRMGRGAVNLPRTTRPSGTKPREVARGATKPAPKITRARPPRETVGRARTIDPISDAVRKARERRAKPSISRAEPLPLAKPGEGRAEPLPLAKPGDGEVQYYPVLPSESFLRDYEGDLLDVLTRPQAADIWKAINNRGSSVDSLAERFNVVPDEIQEVVKEHTKFRSQAFNRFKKQSPKLASAVDSRFPNSKNIVQESVRNGEISDWDSLLNFAVRKPGDKANKEKITEDLFSAFPKGKDPDGKGKFILGYRKTKRPIAFGMVRDIANVDSIPEGFVDAASYRRVAPTIESRATSARDMNERATRARQFREYQRNIDTRNSWSTSVSGRMAAGPPMSPSEENDWRMREWKRQQLKKLSMTNNFSSRPFPELEQVLGPAKDTNLAGAIANLDNLDDDGLNSLWDSTSAQLQQLGLRVPAFRSVDAPLTPRELAMAANAKRPLVTAFLDEVKKLNPNSNLAKIDIDSLKDREIEDLFNTFIMPELTNPGMPSIQDVQIAAGLPKSQEMISLADTISWVLPDGYDDLQTKTLIAREKLRLVGMNPDDPAFDEALRQLIESEYDSEINEIEKWLETGVPPTQVGRGGDGGGLVPPPPINPNTGAPFDKESWEEQIQEVYRRFQEDTERLQDEARAALEELYEIGRQQGWIDDEESPGGDGDPDRDDIARDDLPSDNTPMEDEYGYPDTDEAWDAPYVDEMGNEVPYDGSETHPLNVNPETNQPYDVTTNNTMDNDLYRMFLDPNNYHTREWMDLDNSHTVGRYTKPPAELAARFYDGDIDDADPEKIDKRIDWDRLITYIQKVSPHFFKRNRKGEMLADMAQITQSGNYDGASFNPTPDPDADPSGYQLRQQMKEYVEAKIKEEAAELTASTPAGKNRRAQIWNLLQTGSLTPEEIAFDEKLFDVQNVNAALAMYALENNIPQKQLNDLLNIANTSFPTRENDFAKKRVQRIADQFQDQGKTAREALREIDRAIEHQIELRTKVGLEYDQFRREYMALRNMITSILMMRPKNRRQTYNRDGSIREKGWEPKKESASRYLNRIARWDREFIGHVGQDGQWRPGIVAQLVRRLRQNEIISGAVGGGGATSDIFRTADQNIERLREMREMIEEARGEAKRYGVSGMMRAGGMPARVIGNAEDRARQSARKAAAGYSVFASPRSLKRYDDFGLPISRDTRVSASGFNRALRDLVKDATRARNFKWSDSKYFNMLDSRLKDVVRGLDSTPYTFSNRGFRAMFPNRATRGNRSGFGVVKPEDFNAFELIPGDKIFKSANRTKQRRSVSGAMRLMVDNIEGKYYVTDRNGDIVIDSPFDSEDDALFFTNRFQRDYDDKPEFRFDDRVRFEAFRQGIDSYRYHGENRIRANAENMNSEWVQNESRKPKKVAADAVIFRVNPETGEKEVAMIRRVNPPFDEDYEVALPGGFVDETDIPDGETEINDQTFINAAKREKLEEVGITEDDIIRTEFIGEVDEPDWDPRFPNGMRVGGVFFEVKPTTMLREGSDAKAAFWVPLNSLANGKQAIAFGHAGFISAMLWDDTSSRLAEKFATISQLQRRRNQRIIREVNRRRAILNLSRPKNDQIPMFPKDLPNPDVGYVPGGAAATNRAMSTYRRLTGRMSGQPSKDIELNDGIRYALVNYTGDGFGLLNQLLRETNGLVLDRNLIKDREALRDAITTRDPSSLATRIAMGTDASYERLMKELDIYRDMNDWLNAGTLRPNTVLYRTLGGWQGIEKMKVGDEFYDGSFQSTTSNMNQGFLFGPRNLRIFVGEGVSGRALSEGIEAPRFSEDEVILPAGVRYKILRTPDGKDRKRGDIASSFWDVEIVSQGVSGAMRGKNSFPWNVYDGMRRSVDSKQPQDNLSAAITRSVSGKMAAIPRKQYVGRDFYGDLDIQPTATDKEIKDAYRAIAKAFHPDKTGNDKVAADKFRRASEAFEVLKDRRERDYYDSTILPTIQRDATRRSTAGTTPPRSGTTPPRSGASEPPRRRTWDEQPQRPARKPLPKLKDALLSRIDVKVSIKDNIVPTGPSLSRYRKMQNEPGVNIPGPDGTKIRFDEDRFWDVHFRIAEAINDAVKNKRPSGQPKRYIVIGGPPAAGKSSLRNDKSGIIPSFDSAAHVDADEIKELIPEARVAHGLNDPEWASIVHDESRMITNATLKMAVERGNDVVHDSLGQFREGLDDLRAAKAAGYEVVAHYVVAPLEVIDARLKEREKTDPRILPRHIAGATIDANKYRMVDVAEIADEFYLYDGESSERKLIARKLKGAQLEILDAKAYKYGRFEELVADDPFFERPDTSKRTDSVAKNNYMADVIREFDAGATVSELAQKYKMRRRDVYNAVTHSSVDENRTEAPPSYGRGSNTGKQKPRKRNDINFQESLWGYGSPYIEDDPFDGREESFYGDEDDIRPSSNQVMPNELINMLSELYDSGDIHTVRNLIYYWENWGTENENANVKAVLDVGATMDDINMMRAYADSINTVFGESGHQYQGDKRQSTVNKLVNELNKEDWAELSSLLEGLARELKQGIVAPSSEFVGLADEFDLPMWVIDELFERYYEDL